MKDTQRKNLLIWFSKEGFHFFIENGTGILFYPFSPDSVMYFDIFDDQKFSANLEAFLTVNNISNVTGYMIVDQNAVIENYFVKNNEKVLSDFLENIPYESVISKVSEKGDSMHAIGFNGAFYSALNSQIEKRNGTIAAVLPYILIPQTKLDVQNAPLILKKAITLIDDSMLTGNENNGTNLNSAGYSKEAPPKEKSILPYLVPVFLVLVGVLVYLLMTQF